MAALPTVEDVDSELHLTSSRVARKVPHRIILFLKYLISVLWSILWASLLPLHTAFALVVKEK